MRTAPPCDSGYGKYGESTRDAASRGVARPAFHAANRVRNDAAVALRPGPPPRPQADSVERDAAQKQERGQVEPQVMPLEPRVVGENLSRGEPEGGAAERLPFARQQHGSEPDPVSPKLPPQLRPVFLRREEMAAVRDQRAHLVEHAPAEVRRAAGERDDDRFGVFAEQPEDPPLQPLLHATVLVTRRRAHAASGVTAAIAVTGP